MRFWVFCAMLLMAMAGMGFTMSFESGGWEFWVFLLAVYGAVSTLLTLKQPEPKRGSAARVVLKQALHWCSVLLIYVMLFVFEQTGIVSRNAASDVALLFLSLACVLAGIHFDWSFALIGVVLGLMAVTMAYFEQAAVWLIMAPAVVLAGLVYLQIVRRRARLKIASGHAGASPPPA